MTLFSFTVTTISPSLTWAVERDEAPPVRRGHSEVRPEELQAGHEKAEGVLNALPVEKDRAVEPRPDREELQSSLASDVVKKPAADVKVEAAAIETAALPTGADKSGVTSQAISVPKGSGTIQGMGESFSAQLSTGIATFLVSDRPKQRGAVALDGQANLPGDGLVQVHDVAVVKETYRTRCRPVCSPATILRHAVVLPLPLSPVMTPMPRRALTDASGFGEGAFTLRLTAMDDQVLTDESDELPGFEPGSLVKLSKQFE